MKILSSLPPAAVATAVKKTQPTNAPQKTGGVRGDSVAIGSHASRLSALENAIQQQPIVDQDKVAAIKAAIASGQFSVNPNAIADSLIASAQELLATRIQH